MEPDCANHAQPFREGERRWVVDACFEGKFFSLILETLIMLF